MEALSGLTLSQRKMLAIAVAFATIVGGFVTHQVSSSGSISSGHSYMSEDSTSTTTSKTLSDVITIGNCVSKGSSSTVRTVTNKIVTKE